MDGLIQEATNILPAVKEDRDAKMDPYKIDEGYSEETRSQDGLDSPMMIDSNNEAAMLGQNASFFELQDAVLSLGDNERKEIAYNILRSLRASSIASVVSQLWPLFHKDPVTYFPAEIMSQIFSYLDPANLLEASRTSRAWRARILDGRLWRDKFQNEGWGLDLDEIQRFERLCNSQKKTQPAMVRSPKGLRSPTNPRSRVSRSLKHKARISQRRDRTSTSDEPTKEIKESNQLLGELNSAQVSSSTHAVEEMPDAEDLPSTDYKDQSQISIFDSQGRDRGDASESDSSAEQTVTGTELVSDLSPESSTPRASINGESLMTFSAPGQIRLNYHFLYKQKRRLEENWNAGRYKPFQLPHRDHPEDAHTECVYTIQYLGRHLVSGSRDRTLRIWDLDTQRLARRPLQGHTGSVLCLQFDDSEEEDIIISGSSDTHVILWKFSTGQMLRQLTRAHKESVLNLRFDKRFLVTCSKDKTIKIWSRHELKPGDRNYPVKGVKAGGQCPSYVIDFASIPQALKFGPSRSEHKMSLEPYTHLMTLDLHGAAVNAIQIYEDQLVSASGDRCLRIWNIHTGECSTKIEAHSKGIACVQYDGKRIVSGSSDNTIRIWDPITHVEVARLEGHSRLVRTIQAAFADVPGGREKLEVEAAEVDHQWLKAKQAGLITEPSRRGPQPFPGSRKPNHIRALNAKIPPSGGGGRWSHIVSGSYDENVIVWKKTVDDEWVVGHRLRQDEALRAAGPELPTRSDLGQAENGHDQQVQAPAAAPPPFNLAQQIVQQAATDARTQHNASQGTQSWITHALNGIPQTTTQASAATSNSQAPSTHLPNANILQHASNPHNPPSTHPPPNVPNPRPPLLANRPRPHPMLPPNTGGQPNARVFKLQFDARRIICCSQDPKIVGWDFANGDDRIIESSRFFAAPL